MRVVLLLVCGTLAVADQPRIFITDSNSWAVSGGFSAASSGGTGAAAGRISGGSKPQTVEVIKEFGKRCPAVTVTMDKDKAQYVVLFDYDATTLKHSRIAVFKNGGDVVYAGSTVAIGSAVKDACAALQKLPTR